MHVYLSAVTRKKANQSRILNKLQAIKFPEYKWEKLANGLMMARMVEEIEATCNSNTAKLNKLIGKWANRVDGKPAAETWGKLVGAVWGIGEKTLAKKLAQDREVNVPCPVEDEDDEDD